MQEQEQEARLKEEILLDARKKADHLLERARQDAGKLVAAVETRLAKERQEALAQAGREADARAHAIIAGIRHEVQKNWLRRRERLMDAAFAEALARVTGGTDAERAQSLPQLLEEGVQAIGPESGIVITVQPADVAILAPEVLRDVARRAGAAEVADSWKVTADPSCHGGIIIVSADGRRRVDQTHAARLGRLKAGLRRAVAAALGADGIDIEALVKEGSADV